MRHVALVLLLSACERNPSFVGPWDIVQAERGGDVQTDVGWLDFDGDGSVVVFLAYDHGGEGFEPLQQPVYTTEATNITAVDVEGFYNERPPFETVEIGGFGVFDVDSYTGIRTVFVGPVTWLGGPESERTTLVLRR